MHNLTKLIREDMKPALGVTEPGAIAFAVAKAKSFLSGEVEAVLVRLNSGIYKNAFTCGIPGSSYVGNEHAAALGAVAADSSKGLECLNGITERERKAAALLVEEHRIQIEMAMISSRIFIEATVQTTQGRAMVTIRDSHTNIVKITVNDETILETESQNLEEQNEQEIHQYTLQQIVDYASHIPIEEIRFISEAYDMNLELFEEGMRSNKTSYLPFLLQENGGQVISDDEQKTASLLCNGAIEARVIGLDRPAMSITGSGAHGIISTMPLYGTCKVNGYSEEALLRATAISYLICMYIKEYSGKLSAFCGCAIAAGTGMACGLVYLKGGTVEMMTHTIQNMASSITGMICDGGNHGCTMKGIVAVDAAFSSVKFAMKHVYIDAVHGINGKTPEDTMRFMGRIASPGMEKTEETMIEILKEK